MNRGVGLRGEHNRRPRFANRTAAVVGKGQFRAGNDFLSFVREKDDEVITLAGLSGFVEPAQSMEIRWRSKVFTTWDAGVSDGERLLR